MFDICLRYLIFPIFFSGGGGDGRCWPKPTYEEKMRVPTHPLGRRGPDPFSWKITSGHRFS